MGEGPQASGGGHLCRAYIGQDEASTHEGTQGGRARRLRNIQRGWEGFSRFRGHGHVAHLPVHGVQVVQLGKLLDAVVLGDPGGIHGAAGQLLVVEAGHAHLRGASLHAGTASVVVVEEPEGQLVAVGDIAHAGSEQNIAAV